MKSEDEVMTRRNWSDNTMLKGISNPTGEAYEIKLKIPEITFEGVRGQPDFGCMYVTFYPDKKVIELKSLKDYFYQFRSRIYSYERLINVVYDDLMEVYKPQRLRLVLICNPRGGISSKLTVDSDWGIRGGDEKHKDWVGQQEEWQNAADTLYNIEGVGVSASAKLRWKRYLNELRFAHEELQLVRDISKEASTPSTRSTSHF